MAKKKAEPETEEEKAERLRLEEINAKENERRQSEIKRAELRILKKREDQYGHINNAKINSQWRRIQRIAKLEEIKSEIEIIAQTHERSMDHRNATIQILYDDMEEADEEHRRAIRGYGEVVTELFELQGSRMKSLESQFERELQSLENCFKKERNDIVVRHELDSRDLQIIISRAELEFKEADANDLQDFESHREEIKNKDSEEYNVLKIQLEANIEELEQQSTKAHKAFIEATENRSQAFEKLQKNNTAATSAIEMRRRKLSKLNDNLIFWRSKITSTLQLWDNKNKKLKYQKDLMKKHYQTLKKKIENFRAAEGQRLKHVSVCSARAMEKLSIGELVLKISEMCKKLETQKEKIWLFCPDSVDIAIEDENCLLLQTPDATEQENSKSNLETSATMEILKKDKDERSCFENFFKKYNKVLIEKICIEKEKKRLRRENEELKAILKEYLDGISINSDVMNNPANTLMVINQRLQKQLSFK